MFNRILFPTDFSKDGYSALRYAISLTRFVGGELIVQHVVNNFFGPHSHWASLFDVHGIQKEMDFHIDTEVMTLLPEEAKSRTVIRPLILQGKPPEQICKVAREEMVDLVVMSQHEEGVTTMQVIRNTARPVLAFPLDDLDPEAVPSVQRVLVATDFTRESKRVTDYAFEIKKTSLQCPLYFIHAVKTPGALERVMHQDQVHASLERSRNWAHNQTINVTPAEFIADGSVSTLVKLGRTSDCIIDAAEEIDASLIIMGAKGYSAGQGFFYGTTVNRVLNNVRCPVLTLQV